MSYESILDLLPVLIPLIIALTVGGKIKNRKVEETIKRAAGKHTPEKKREEKQRAKPTPAISTTKVSTVEVNSKAGTQLSTSLEGQTADEVVVTKVGTNTNGNIVPADMGRLRKQNLTPLQEAVVKAEILAAPLAKRKSKNGYFLFKI